MSDRATFFARLRRYAKWRAGQLARAPERTANFLFGNAYNDLVLARRIKRHTGSAPVGRRICVFAIYPACGLWPSHVDTVAAVAAAGYSPVVVSNLPLTPSEIEQLAPHSWIILERPNFGYDFGAYRTGIRMLKDRADAIDDLVLLNDSIWFPMGPKDWLDRVTGAPDGLVAAVPNYGVRLTPPSSPGMPAGWAYDPTLPRLHYCSFALRIGPEILGDTGFWRFWENVRLTNDKFTTVRRGEIGFSRWVIDKGFGHATTFPVASLPEVFERKDMGELRAIAEKLVIPEDPGLRASRDAILDAPAVTETQLRNFILAAIKETGPAYAAPELAISELGVFYLKKSPVWLDDASASVTFDILKRRCPETYLAEAEALRASRSPRPTSAAPGTRPGA